MFAGRRAEGVGARPMRARVRVGRGGTLGRGLATRGDTIAADTPRDDSLLF